MFEEMLRQLDRRAFPSYRVWEDNPVPGVYVWRFECASFPEDMKPLPEGHYETLFCQRGGIDLEREGEGCLGVGENQILVTAGPLCVRGARVKKGGLHGVLISVHSNEAKESLAVLCRLFGGLDLDSGKVETRMAAKGGCVVVGGTPWSGAVAAALEELPSEDQGRYALLKSLELLYLIQCGSPAVFPVGHSPYCDTYQRERIHQVRNYMLAHLEEPLTIQSLSAQFHLSATALKAGFRQIYQQSAHAYLRERRLERAAKLLSETTMTVIQVALAVGYGSVSQFGVAFRKQYQLSPSQYRRAEQKKIQNRQSLSETEGNTEKDVVSLSK